VYRPTPLLLSTGPLSRGFLYSPSLVDPPIRLNLPVDLFVLGSPQSFSPWTHGQGRPALFSPHQRFMRIPDATLGFVRAFLSVPERFFEYSLVLVFCPNSPPFRLGGAATTYSPGCIGSPVDPRFFQLWEDLCPRRTFAVLRPVQDEAHSIPKNGPHATFKWSRCYHIKLPHPF